MLCTEFTEMEKLIAYYKDKPKWIMKLFFVLISHWYLTNYPKTQCLKVMNI